LIFLSLKGNFKIVFTHSLSLKGRTRHEFGCSFGLNNSATEEKTETVTQFVSTNDIAQIRFNEENSNNLVKFVTK